MSGSSTVSALEADMTFGGTVTLSAKELDRLEVLGRVAERWLTQRRAAEQLGLSEPRSLHEAHCPLRDDEDLARIFTWQENRKLSRNLTLHYKRVAYLVEPGAETLPLAGEPCRVHEAEDGRIEIFHAGKSLLYRVFFEKDPHVSQGDIVANKRLGAVLAQIQADQRERDLQRLANPKLTLRQKERIRAAQARAEASTPSPATG
jgi:hypothetical protein